MSFASSKVPSEGFGDFLYWCPVKIIIPGTYCSVGDFCLYMLNPY